jgi:ankyrin repeat protein
LKNYFAVIISFLFISCGQHESSNYGFSANGDISDGLKASTIPGKLKTAMDTGDKEEFVKLMTDDVDVNTRLPDTKNATLLIYSAIKNVPLITHFLINRGADIALTDDDGKTAFERAEEIGNRERILMLIDSDRQKEAQMALMEAVIRKKVQTIEDLLVAGTDPNFIDEETGETPLTRSVLLKKGTHVTKFIAEWKDPGFDVSATDIDFPNREGFTPLGYAIEKNITDVIDVLKSLNAKEIP